MMGPMMYGPYGGWMFFHFFFWILIIIGVVLLIVWLVRQPGRYERGHGEESPLDILMKRYARGEISKEGHLRACFGSKETHRNLPSVTEPGTGGRIHRKYRMELTESMVEILQIRKSSPEVILFDQIRVSPGFFAVSK